RSQERPLAFADNIVEGLSVNVALNMAPIPVQTKSISKNRIIFATSAREDLHQTLCGCFGRLLRPAVGSQ
ncbi:MAG: hypothetical protein AAF543_11205, partial [Pseudomonadota bacterium]